MAWLNSCFPDSPQAAVSGKQKHIFRLISCIFFRQKRGEPFTLCPMFNNMHKPHVRTGICPQFPQFSTFVSPKVIHTIFIMIFRHFRLIHRLIHIIHMGYSQKSRFSLEKRLLPVQIRCYNTFAHERAAYEFRKTGRGL